MEFKGTKGKWELTDDKRGIDVNIKPYTYESICSSTGNTKWQYDMLLISKSLEMLEMLINIKEHLNDDDKWSVEQLIKQATEL